MKAILIALVSLLTLSAAARAETKLSIAAFRVTAPDIEATADFYERHFDLAEVGRYPGIIVLADAKGTAIVLTPSQHAATPATDACSTRINFAVPDLDASLEALKADGVRVLGTDESAVGRYATFIDPAGHTHNVKQQQDPGDAAFIYNASVRVTDMPRSRAFYEGTLGFEPVGEQYYPPVIPMVPVSDKQFILTDKTATKAAASDEPGGVAWAGLAFESDDLDAAVAELRAKGVRFLADAPRTNGPVRVIAFADADGNVHELIEHITGAQAASPTDEHLAFLAGHWVSESPDGSVIEEHWLEPAGGSTTGVLRWRNAAGDVSLLEILTIRTEDGRGVFRWRHFDKDLKPWDAEKEVPSIVTIESFEANKLVMVRHPDGSPRTPARMTYDGSVPGTLTATLEFEGGRAPIVIVFEQTE